MAGIEVWTNGEQRAFIAFLGALNDVPAANRTLNKITRASNLTPQRTRDCVYGALGSGWITREFIGNTILLSITPVGKNALHVFRKAPPDIFIDTPHRTKERRKSNNDTNSNRNHEASNDTAKPEEREDNEQNDEWKNERLGDSSLQR